MLLTALAAGLGAAFAGVWTTPIIGGTATSDHPEVVALVDGNGAPYCSGVLITPRLVLTAAHCVRQGLEDVVPAAVFFGARTSEPGERIAADATWVAPSYRPGILVADVALVRLAEDATIAPAPLPGDGVASVLLGRDIELVGFGYDVGGNPGVKRTVVAAVILDDGVAIRYDDGSCYGDSGGPVFLAGVPPQLIASISSGRPDCSGGRAVRLDVLRTELEAGIAALSERGDGGCRAGPSPSREPPVLAELAAAAALLLVLRRRRRRRHGHRHATATQLTET